MCDSTQCCLGFTSSIQMRNDDARKDSLLTTLPRNAFTVSVLVPTYIRHTYVFDISHNWTSRACSHGDACSLAFHVVHLRCAPWLYTGQVDCNDVAQRVLLPFHTGNATSKISVCCSQNGFADVTDSDMHGDQPGHYFSDAQYLFASVRICRLGAGTKHVTSHTVPAR